MNLKKVLMELGNKLVTEHGYEPVAYVKMQPEFLEQLEHDKTTGYITMLTIWLNKHPEAQQQLKEMGIEWPMPKGNR